MSPETILPAFVLRLTDSPMAVSMIRVVYAVGMWLPILYAPNLIRRVKWRGKYVAIVGMVERAPMLVIGLTAPLLAASNPSAMLVVFFACWLVRSVSEGLNLSAYASLLDESIPETYRGRLWGVSTGISAVLALPIGFWTAHYLATRGFPQGYADLFIIGFVIFVPFLVIDLVVSAVLMSLGMMMLPPVFVSLPFKILLFVMVDGWALIAHALLANYH